MDNWCTIESDPGVFSEQIEKIGCKGISVEEIYSLEDKYMLEKMMPIYGLIFQFKWTKNPEPRECLQFYDEDLFFANQMINNACATQALLSCLMNIQDLEMSQEQVEFKQFCKVIDSQSRGLAIGESELLRNVHNSFAKPEPFVYSEKRKAKDDDDVFHFISYIPFKGKVVLFIRLKNRFTNQMDFKKVQYYQAKLVMIIIGWIQPLPRLIKESSIIPVMRLDLPYKL